MNFEEIVQTDEIPCELRAAAADDHAFVISSFLKSHRFQGDNQHLSNPEYYRQMTPTAEALARRCAVVIAADVEDAWHIYGWIAFDRGDGEARGDASCVHYVYVKFPMRRLGVARRLYTHVNPTRAPMVVSLLGRAFDALRGPYALSYEPRKVPR